MTNSLEAQLLEDGHGFALDTTEPGNGAGGAVQNLSVRLRGSGS
jgi:hypothetical protein